jgi:hypothetical protein
MRKVKIVVLLFLLIIALCACDSNIVQPIDTAKQMYIGVLQNNIGFYDCGSLHSPKEGEYINLIEYLNCPEAATYGYTFAVTQFTFLEIEGSNTPAVILETSPPFPGMRLLLHYHDGKVYGYFEGFRSMRGIKTDGTFCWASGAGHYGTAKLQFSPEGYPERVEVCRMYSGSDAVAVFYIYGEEVSEDLFSAFYYEEHHQKEDATWYAFDSETIAEEFVAAWYHWPSRGR